MQSVVESVPIIPFQMPVKDRPARDGHKVNREIRAKNVLVIDENGEKLGVMFIRDAITKAESVGLDLIEVFADANPPVCKIADYGKMLYDAKKKIKKNEHKREEKEIRTSPNIGQHDLEIKATKALEFLKEGHKVKFTVKFEGRQAKHPELAKAVIDNMIKFLGVDVVEYVSESSLDSRLVIGSLKLKK